MAALTQPCLPVGFSAERVAAGGCGRLREGSARAGERIGNRLGILLLGRCVLIAAEILRRQRMVACSFLKHANSPRRTAASCRVEPVGIFCRGFLSGFSWSRPWSAVPTGRGGRRTGTTRGGRTAQPHLCLGNNARASPFRRRTRHRCRPGRNKPEVLPGSPPIRW
jgi:hypothetical protein